MRVTKDWLLSTVRMFVVAVATTVVVIAGLTLFFGEQAQQEQMVNEQQRDANLAIACVLTLPSDPVTGRDPDDVDFCFTQYGLEPPGHIGE